MLRRLLYSFDLRRSSSNKIKTTQMKKIVIAGCLLLSAGLAHAQQKEGKVKYESVSSFVVRMNINGEENSMPQTRKDNFELHFTGNQSLWKSAEQDAPNEAMGGGEESGMHLVMINPNSDNVVFTDFETGKKVEKRSLLDKTFIIDDTINKLKWKMTGETKSILNHNCMKATTTRVSTRTQMSMDNGTMERKEITDTVPVIAWFTTDIPVSAGPNEYQGQLPGLILEMDINNGKETFTAKEIAVKPDVSLIKEPSGKKHYTRAEYKKESDKMMKEMQQNMQGGQRQIRMN